MKGLPARLRSVYQVCRNRPHVVLVPLTITGLILGLGIWAVVNGAQSTSDTERQKALSAVQSAASALQLTIQDTIIPAIQQADWVKMVRNITLIEKEYFNVIPDYYHRSYHSLSVLGLAPAGVMTRYYPGTLLTIPPFDILDSPFRDAVIESIVKRNITVAPPGPSQASERPNAKIMAFQVPVILYNVTKAELWQGRKVSNCPMCYDPITKSGWWGSSATIVYLDEFINENGPTSKLIDAGYRMQIWRSPSALLNETEWSVLDGSEPVPQPADAIGATLPVANGTDWRIDVWQDSWEPSWKLPLIIVVVVAGVVCGLLVFMVLLSWEEHRVLLHSILPKEAINRMRQQIDFDTLKQDQQALKGIEIETPAQHILSILECVLAGETPPMSMVVAVQQALQRSQDVYRPASDDLKMRLKEDSRLDDEVQRALVNQLAGFTDSARNTHHLLDTTHGNIDASKRHGRVSMSESGGALIGTSAGTCKVDFNSIDSALEYLATAEVTADDLIPTSSIIENPVYASRDTELTDHMAVVINPEKPILDKLDRVLATANTWQFDAYALEEASSGHPLSVLGYWLMHTSGCMQYARMHGVVLARFLRRIEAGYKTNAYHNKRHAADVLQTFHMIMHQGGLKPGYVDELTLLGCYLAAIVHDYEHVGRSNDFLVNTRDTLALRYNDKSPMENHHLAAAWELLQQPEYNCLSGLSKTKWEQLRKLVIDLVLATDMRQHFAIMGQFTALHSLQTTGAARLSMERSHASSASASRSPSVHGHVPVNEQDKLLSLQVALKCSDLGHLAAPLNVHLKWVSALEEELFLQGDEERRRGMPLSPLCDRNKEGVTKSQVGFMEFVVLPIYTNFCQRFKASQPLHHAVLANYHHWKNKADAERTSGPRPRPS